MQKLYSVVIGISVFLFIISCGNKTSSIRFNENWESYYIRVDSTCANVKNASKYLDSCILEAESKNERQLKLELSLLSYIYKREKFVKDEKNIRLLKTYEREAEENNWATTRAESYQQLANYYFNSVRDIKTSMLYYYKAYNIYKKMSVEEFPQKFRLLYEFSSVYYELENYDKAIEYMKDAVQIRHHSKGNVVSAYNTISVAYRNIEQYDSAILYLNKGLVLAKKYKLEEWDRILKGNIGGVYYLEKKYIEAKPYFNEDLERSVKGNDYRSAGSIYLIFSKIALESNQNDSALFYVNTAREYSAKAQDRDILLLANIHNHYYNYFKNNGNNHLAILHNDSAMLINDSIQKLNDKKQILKAQQLLDQEYFQTQLDEKLRFNKYIRNSLSIGILLLSVVIFLIINRHKILKAKSKEEKEHIQKELNLAQEKILTFAKNLNEKNELIEKIKQMKEAEKQDEEKYATIAQLEKSILLTEEQWSDFVILFEKAYGNYLQRLRAKIPEISPAEIRIIALTKLKLPNKSMAAMMGVTADAIRMNKFRLRKKLNLEDEQDLEIYLDKI